MSVSEATRHARGSRWSMVEKQRIVELTLREGASITEIALAHGVPPTSLSHWRSLHRSGKLTGDPQKPARVSATSAKFLPVTITAEQEHNSPSPRETAPSTVSMQVRERNSVYLSLPSGATVRIETDALDVTLIRVLLADLRT